MRPQIHEDCFRSWLGYSFNQPTFILSANNFVLSSNSWNAPTVVLEVLQAFNKAKFDMSIEASGEFGSKSTILQLLATGSGFDVNYQDENGWTVLLNACLYGNEDIVDELLRVSH